jgi:predicted neutral ceramidase superfamily lipid hydrolase
MKAIKIINTIAIGTPSALFLIDLVVQGGLSIFALLSTMFTGFVQVVLGLFLMIRFPNNRYYQIYIVSVISFFVLWFIVYSFNLYDFHYLLLGVPPCLAVYLSVLIYSRPNNEF